MWENELFWSLFSGFPTYHLQKWFYSTCRVHCHLLTNTLEETSIIFIDQQRYYIKGGIENHCFYYPLIGVSGIIFYPCPYVRSFRIWFPLNKVPFKQLIWNHSDSSGTIDGKSSSISDFTTFPFWSYALVIPKNTCLL